MHLETSTLKKSTELSTGKKLNQVDISENIVQLISCGNEVWYKRQNLQIVERTNYLKKLTQFIQSKIFPKEK